MSQVGDDPGESGGDGHDQRVAVLDMRQLVGEDAFELVVVQHAHDAFSHRHGGMLRAPAGGERIGRVTGDQVDAGHGDAGLGGEPAYDPVQVRALGLLDRLSPVHGQHDAIGKPVAPEVHGDGEDKGDQHALLAANGVADQDHQTGQRGQQDRGLEDIPHRRASCLAC